MRHIAVANIVDGTNHAQHEVKSHKPATKLTIRILTLGMHPLAAYLPTGILTARTADSWFCGSRDQHTVNELAVHPARCGENEAH